uniref:Uncharacterized protein n=1 Tax=Otus sunia TaxID=257818 RepID=A0A8C8ABP8_9STRI
KQENSILRNQLYDFCTLLCRHLLMYVLGHQKSSLERESVPASLLPALSALPNQSHREIKVLVVARNIPTRLFPDWHVAIATAPATRPRDPMQAQSTAEVVAECLALLLKLADCIQNFKDTNENVHTLAPELLIPAETINYLCNAEECASPEDFLRIYLSPSQPALDSETVWPVPSHFSV